MNVQPAKPIRLNPQDREILSYALKRELACSDDPDSCRRVIAKLDEQIASAQYKISQLRCQIDEWRRARRELRLVAGK